MALVTVVILAAFVLPKFEDFFESLDAELPLPTRMLLGVTDFLSRYWWACSLGAGVVVVDRASCTSAPSREGTRATGSSCRLPVIGDVVRYALVERFCRILGSMVRAGVPLPEAMTVATESQRTTASTSGGSTRSREAMLAGEGLAGPLARTGLFPARPRQMIRVGEETGHARQPARASRPTTTSASSTTSSSASPRCSSRPSSSSWA